MNTLNFGRILFNIFNVLLIRSSIAESECIGIPQNGSKCLPLDLRAIELLGNSESDVIAALEKASGGRKPLGYCVNGEIFGSIKQKLTDCEYYGWYSYLSIQKPDENVSGRFKFNHQSKSTLMLDQVTLTNCYNQPISMLAEMDGQFTAQAAKAIKTWKGTVQAHHDVLNLAGDKPKNSYDINVNAQGNFSSFSQTYGVSDTVAVKVPANSLLEVKLEADVSVTNTTYHYNVEAIGSIGAFFENHEGTGITSLAFDVEDILGETSDNLTDTYMVQVMDEAHISVSAVTKLGSTSNRCENNDLEMERQLFQI